MAKPAIHRDEVEARLFAIADLNVNVWRILIRLEEEFGEETEVPEDGA